MENLRKLRKARKLTQADLSEMTGIGQGFLSRIEKGTGNPTLDIIVLIAATLKVDPSELFALSEVKRRTLEAVAAIEDADRQEAAIVVLESMARAKQTPR